jgi:hypothetical protein
MKEQNGKKVMMYAQLRGTQFTRGINHQDMYGLLLIYQHFSLKH